MTSKTHSPETSGFSDLPQEFYPHADLAEILPEYRENSLDELDDETIIWRFAQGKKRLVINDNLRIDYAHNSLQLSTPNNELIAIHKVAERLHYILIKKDSKYSEAIQNIIADCQFIPIDTATADRGFMRFQKYEIPAGYHLRYESAAELWQEWQDAQQQLTNGLQLDILILARAKWYRVQQTICTDDRLDLQTRLGLISLSLRDRIAWISKLGTIPTVTNADLTVHSSGNSGGTDSEILGKIISKLAIDASPDDDLHFNPDPNMSSSVFSEPHDYSILDDEDRSSTLTGYTLSPITEQLRASAIGVLEDYLEHGETIVRTETIVDPQGNIISEKTLSTHRGCPRWAIEASIYWW
jgi:hypothetical protein